MELSGGPDDAVLVVLRITIPCRSIAAVLVCKAGISALAQSARGRERTIVQVTLPEEVGLHLVAVVPSPLKVDLVLDSALYAGARSARSSISLLRTHHRDERGDDADGSDSAHACRDGTVQQAVSRREARSSALLGEEEDELVVLDDRGYFIVHCVRWGSVRSCRGTLEERTVVDGPVVLVCIALNMRISSPAVPRLLDQTYLVVGEVHLNPRRVRKRVLPAPYQLCHAPERGKELTLLLRQTGTGAQNPSSVLPAGLHPLKHAFPLAQNPNSYPPHHALAPFPRRAIGKRTEQQGLAVGQREAQPQEPVVMVPPEPATC